MIIERIGPHILVNADCREALHVAPFDRLAGDPPYEFDASGGGAYRKARPNGLDAIEAAGLADGFDQPWLINELWTRGVGGAALFCHNDQVDRLMAAMRTPYRRVALLAWHKTNPQPVANKHYLPDTEFWIHGWNEGAHPVPGAGGLDDMHRFLTSPGGRNQYGHPTQKPVDLMAKVITNLGGSAICDPFMGTGSTGVAAVQAGKTFFGIELKAQWFDVACSRIAQAVREREAAA